MSPPGDEKVAEMKEAIGSTNPNPIDLETTVNYILFPIRRKKSLDPLSRKKYCRRQRGPWKDQEGSYLSCLSWGKAQAEYVAPVKEDGGVPFARQARSVTWLEYFLHRRIVGLVWSIWFVWFL